MHHIISHHWSVHGVASSSSRKCGLTNGYARVELRVAFGFLNLSCHCWHYWVATIDFLWWCFSHITMMPRWNLGPHVRCSHMIEPLGARWCQGICDITHCNPLLCNLTSVLTSNPSQGYRVNERLVSRKRTVLRRVLYCVHRKLMHVCIKFYAPPRCIKHGHHHLCTMVYASLGQHHN